MAPIFFVGEGVTDVGPDQYIEPIRLSLDEQGGFRRSSDAPCGVLPLLVLRSLNVSNPNVSTMNAQTRRTRRLHGKGFERKALAAIVDAKARGALALVMVSDRDGEKNRARLSEMKKGRDAAARQGHLLPAALGQCIEKPEAWLLADSKALCEALNIKLPGAIPDPESIRDPKEHLAGFYAQDTSDRRAWERHEAIAGVADVDTLAKHCPKGFRPFRDEVVKRLSPLFEEV